MSQNEGNVSEEVGEHFALKRLRERIVAGDPDPKEARQSPALYEIFEIFDRLMFPIEGREGSTIQSELLAAIKKAGGASIGEEFDRAKRSARGMLFDCVAGCVVGRDAQSGKRDIEEAFINMAIVRDPDVLSLNPAVLGYMVRRLRANGAKCLKELQEDFYNSERRKGGSIQTDWQLAVMARHWTDPDLPLWLMGREAILKACSVLQADENWTDSQIKNRMAAGKLVGASRKVVRDLAMNSSLKLALRFSVQDSVFAEMEQTEFESRRTIISPVHTMTEEDDHRMDEEIRACAPENLHAVLERLGREYPPPDEERVTYRAYGASRWQG